VFSIIIPTFNNLSYLKSCISSIKKNSKFEHEIITDINDESGRTEKSLKFYVQLFLCKLTYIYIKYIQPQNLN
jgi:GT2 family glycosyltransferase